ncbi:a97e6192-3a8f-460e-9933-9c13c9645aba [Thermothielavioides terrestris]|uniref:A97e6192-3a8f-460e-9933-9c13c9645aba n=1 Tax=Thermothielavioides terrestris TaxID=2587410 RepID=A0A3S4BLF2_9PEZI|nr:a97e6192-3a8f-460e-9933-9c13c9645aba [Thermothielavioides terrestris]
MAYILVVDQDFIGGPCNYT